MCMIKSSSHSSTTANTKNFSNKKLNKNQHKTSSNPHFQQTPTTSKHEIKGHCNLQTQHQQDILTMKKEYLDLVLVPAGLLLMLGYHLILVYRYLKCPQNTIIGYENHNKRAWVRKMLQIRIEDRGPAISVLSTNASAAISLASISLVLSSLLGAWMGSSTNNLFTSRYIYGSRNPSMVYVKYISLLSCFLVAFGCFVQTARYFVHANFLISMPDNDIPIHCIQKEVIRGSIMWLMGLRSIYFATNLLLWIFGPIPMFACSVTMVVVLVILDINTTPLHQVMSNNLSAAMSLASISLALSSLIGAWIGSSYHDEFVAARVYGNMSSTIVYIKYLAILSSFMIAFACFVQASRCFVHAGFLISLPNCVMPATIVESAVITGSNFWVIGIRSLYLATILMLWIFGPIPIFAGSVITVVVLQYLDRNTTPLPQYDRPSSYDSSKKIDDDREESEDSRNGTSSLLSMADRT